MNDSSMHAGTAESASAGAGAPASAATGDPSVAFRFDGYELVPRTRELRKRGMRVHLSPQPFQVLLLLVSRAGEVVTREEIQAELWGSGTFVDFEHGVNAVIRRIRLALNDHAETPRFLQTLRHRGYTFTARVERIAIPTSTPAPAAAATPLVITPREASIANEKPSRRATLVAMALLLAAALTITRGPRVVATPRPLPERMLRVAVAPFETIGRAPGSIDPRLFSAELHRILGSIQPDTIRIVDPAEPADLRVAGTLQLVREGLRLDAAIRDGRSGKTLWRESFMRAGREMEELPFEGALRISRAVVTRQRPRGRYEPVLRTAVSPAALALYREGRALRDWSMPQRDLDAAMKLFERAVAQEPRFAEAWSAIGDIWTERALSWRGGPREAAIAQARSALDRALDLDPNCAEAHNDLGVLLLRFDHQIARAEIAIRRAIAIDPDYVDSHLNLSMIHAAMGRTDLAIEEFRRVQQLDPENHMPSQTLALFYLLGSRHAESAAEFRATRLILRRSPIGSWGIMWATAGAGRWDEAARSLSDMLGQPIALDADPARHRDTFRRELRRLIPPFTAREQSGLVDPYALACIHAHVGDLDAAYAALERAYDLKSANILWVAVDPRLAILRGDPRYDPYLEKIGLRRRWRDLAPRTAIAARGVD